MKTIRTRIPRSHAFFRFGDRRHQRKERRDGMYTSPKAELLYPETEQVLSDLLGASKEDNDNGFNITDLLS